MNEYRYRKLPPEEALRSVIQEFDAHATTLEALFGIVLLAAHRDLKRIVQFESLLRDSQTDDDLKKRFSQIEESLSSPDIIDDVYGSEIYAGAIMVVLHLLLDRERNALAGPDRWNDAGKRFGAYSFGRVVEAAANNFKHVDEWIRKGRPDGRQLSSIEPLAAILGRTMPEDRSSHPFEGNVCPEVLLIICDGSFEGLRAAFSAYARALAGIT